MAKPEVTQNKPKKQGGLPEPCLENMTKEQLIALIRKLYFGPTQRQIAVVVWEVEREKARERCQRASDQCDRAGDAYKHAVVSKDPSTILRALDGLTKAHNEWNAAMSYDDAVSAYYQRYLMDPIPDQP